MAVIVDGLRTVIGTAQHGLADRTVDELASVVLAALAQRLPADTAVDDVILGNCLGPGGNPARVAGLRAGLGAGAPGMTIDRQCGSGLDAIAQATARIDTGQDEVILAGGAESPSTAPWRFWPPPSGDAAEDGPDGEAAALTRYRRAPFAPSGFADPEMGPAADALARKLEIGRDRQDAWAARSYQRAWTADRAGRFDAERLPVGSLERDERIRPGMSESRLARFRPAFGPDGTATAANCCPISDGAAAVTVISDRRWQTLGRPPGLRVRGTRVAGGDPALPGAVPATAVTELLARHDIDGTALQAVEITEAFAAQALATLDATGLDPDLVCADGGAIAYGHPWGASGAILVLRLFRRLLTADGTGLGLATCPVGGGQGVAMLLECVR